MQRKRDSSDAFYSWDADALSATMDAPADVDRVLYYQVWAEAGNYAIQTRRPCTHVAPSQMECAITVTDDLGRALGYAATDTFRLAFDPGRFEAGGPDAIRIVAADFAGDDPPVFGEVLKWMAEERPEVFAGPCKDLFEGGTTPAQCVREVVRGARDFAAARSGSAGQDEASPTGRLPVN